MKQTIGDLTIQFNQQERAWEVVGGDKPQRFQTGPIGKQAAIRFAIREAFPDVAAAVDRLIEKNGQAAGPGQRQSCSSTVTSWYRLVIQKAIVWPG